MVCGPEERLHREGFYILGYKVDDRDSDYQSIGIVTDRYHIVQNEDAFRFTDALLGEGVTYETAEELAHTGVMPGAVFDLLVGGVLSDDRVLLVDGSRFSELLVFWRRILYIEN